MRESPPLWIEPNTNGEARLAFDFIPAASTRSRLWFFLHGLNSSRRGEKALYFARQVARNGDAFASLDMTGHGDSEGDLRKLSMTRNIADLTRGLEFVKSKHGPFDSVHLIGSSMGGLTALWFAAQKPEVVTHNIVIAPAFEMASRLLLSLGREKAQEWRRERTIHLETGYADFDLDYHIVEDEARYPILGLVKRLTTPTLIFHGSHDEVVPCQLSRQFAQRIDRVKLVEISGGDHRLTENKEQLFEQMWDFVGPP